MARLYIDYIHAKPSTMNGGANYSRTFVAEIMKRATKENIAPPITLIWPEGYDTKIPLEQEFIDSDVFDILKCAKVEDVAFEQGALLFIPLIGTKDLGLLKVLRGKNPSLKFVVTIHGVRFIDAKCDWYDLKYQESFSRKVKYFFAQMVARPAKLLYYKKVLAENLALCETVITVSNDSLVKIVKAGRVKTIVPQYQKCIFNDYDKEITKTDDRYMLFVSGNREIKNLARSIDAYKKYIAENPEGLSIYVTGVSGKVKETLIKNLSISDLVESGKVKFMPYLSDDELAALLYNAKFLLYPSKSEGFGLPAFEAACFNCPTVAGYGTAIPEVLGTAALYVDPYSINSIVYGMRQMEKPEVNQMYREAINNILTQYKEKTDRDYDVLYGIIKTMIRS